MCVDNTGNEVDLAVGKVYPVLRTEKTARDHHFIRIVDDSGEDYLFSADQFVEIKLPRAGREAVIRALTAPEP